MNLATILQRAARLHGTRCAVACCGHSFTYAELLARAEQLAGVLREEGAGPDAPAAIMHRNCHRYIEAYFAAALLGAVLVPLNNRLSAGELAAILGHSEAKVVLAEPDFISRAAEAAAALPEALRPVLLSHGAGRSGTEGRMEAFRGKPLVAALSRPDDAAQLYYTSGTTGDPKGVILTHGNVASHAMAAIAELGLSETDVWLHAAPLFHLADAWATWAITWVGGRHVIVKEFDPAVVFDVIASEGVTITNLIPAMLVKMVHHEGAVSGKLKSLRRILSGGAPMALELLKRIEKLFPCEYVQTYGLTETSPYLTFSLLKKELGSLPAGERQRFRATTGRPMIGVDLRVKDGKGRDIPWDNEAVGEIVVRGPTVTPGYHKNPAETNRAFRDGWFHTGDLACVGPEGYLTIVDRIKDVINTGGEQVYSTEVEQALYGHPQVREAAVIAVPHDLWGETIKAVVVLQQDAACTSRELAEFCGEKLASFKVPTSIDFRETLPRTGSGKIDKKALREPWWEGREKRVQ